MIKNIVFDFGNVLVKFDVYRILDICSGYHTEHLKEIILHDIDGFDRGNYTNEAYRDKCLELASNDEKQAIYDYFDSWFKVLENIDEVQEWAKALKEEGYKLYLLSNAPDVFEENLELYPILKKFDGLLFSAPIQMIKPHHDIYEYFIQKFHLKKEECIFIDDKQINVDAAIEVGIPAIVFKNNLTEINKKIGR